MNTYIFDGRKAVIYKKNPSQVLRIKNVQHDAENESARRLLRRRVETDGKRAISAQGDSVRS